MAISIQCGSCGLHVGAGVVATSGSGHSSRPIWLRCPSCGEGSVINSNGVVSPTSPAGSTVRHLPEDVQRAWQEVRSAHAVAAYTAAELMCRKILMHLAVDVAEADAGKSFQHYVGVLVDEGYVPKPLEQTIDKVRQRGNTATHELPASTEEESLATLTITEHMLRGIYEIPSI